ncbi:leukocyte-associated immunoglobulin-like receptor 1 isoform X3 [Dama dama]|uniref:leukocyte-associated immunoglobulin-like receptor 1 isoform X3 n=1 Tax=Dama dama TaxID=30532 RepID=UPI002A364FD7|nr:leukocyte-associated immunoglobulin-like receptor 1 isoform X3 [Dama dama]
MARGPSTLLGLALCLAQMACTQQGTLPRPSISAEPGSVVPWGRPVSIVCRGPAGVTTFRLEKDNRHNYTDVAVTSGGEQETEARLHITALHKDNVGRYCCIYGTESSWSERSETLSLEGTEEAVSALPTGPPGGGSSSTAQCCSSAGRPRSNDEEQRHQGRLSPAVDVLDGTPDVASVDRFPDMDGEVGTSTPAAGGPQEVTYAQLNHKPLTQRAARAVSPPSTEPLAESSTYATIARH